MKRIAISIMLIVLLVALAGCTLYSSKTEYDKKTNTVRRTTTILPNLDKELNDLFGN